MKTIKYLFISILSLATFTNCSSDDDNPPPVNEEEVITTLRVTLIPQGGGDTVTLETRDLDGDGPNAPVVTVSGDLAAMTTYAGSVVVLNELEDPADNITLEVQEEDEDHQFFYTLSNNSGVTVAYTDQDADGNPVGLAFTLTTSAASTNNTLTVTLRHEPNKSASGVSNGDITNAGGETDIDASFPFDVAN
ncbi:type 1 periplasmic binding fold superfamily protein [uncultured Psychroserpens sp.]|uniref:type 1 periplasmic binding fold superfamily protein n=1 Tax=uncultured Psychroserpens sp. TaxID=255436 RepID=UPI002611AAB6|nr:type 1 periplasmic binding fold superfamily protein [uncultured Psychroserpens sp.]